MSSRSDARQWPWYLASAVGIALSVAAVLYFYPRMGSQRALDDVMVSVLLGPVAVVAAFAFASLFLRSTAEPAPGVDDVKQRRKEQIYSLIRRHMACYQLVLVVAVAAISGWTTLPIGSSPPMALFWVVVAVATVGLLVEVFRGERKANIVADEESDTDNPLKWGLIYWDPSDKRVLIPWDDWNMRFNWGYPLTWIAFTMLISFISIPAVLLIVFG